MTWCYDCGDEVRGTIAVHQAEGHDAVLLTLRAQVRALVAERDAAFARVADLEKLLAGREDIPSSSWVEGRIRDACTDRVVTPDDFVVRGARAARSACAAREGEAVIRALLRLWRALTVRDLDRQAREDRARMKRALAELRGGSSGSRRSR